MSDDATVMAAEELGEFAEAVEETSIAPLGRNYFDRYREVRDAVREMAEEDGDALSEERLAEHLEADDYEFLEAIVRNLDNFAEQGFQREGQVEPYLSARADADRLEPYLELIDPHLTG